MELELVTFNADNVKAVKTGKPSISISFKTGMMAFSKTASEALNLKDGDKIELHQDNKRPEDWYFSINQSNSGFDLRMKYGNKYSGGLIQNSVLARKILSSLGVDDSQSFLVSTTPLELSGGTKIYAIITKSAK